MKPRLVLPAVLLALVAIQTAWADLTIRYKISFQPGTGLPQQAAQSIQAAIKNVPAEVVMQIRGDMARSEFQNQTTLVDYGKRQLTVLDAKTQRFATAPLSDLPVRLSMAQASLPPDAAEALHNLKIAVEKKPNGQMGIISGIRAEESAVTIAVTIPAPRVPSTPAHGTGPIQALQLRFAVTEWKPLDDEMARIPALKEYAVWSTRARGLLDSAGLLNSVFSALPGLGEQMRGAFVGLAKDDRPALRVQIALSLPNLAALATQSGQPGMAIPAGLDLSRPLLEMTYELAELSTVPLSDALFSVPAGFRSVTMQEIAPARAAVVSTQRSVPPPSAPATTPAAIITMPPGVYKVGGGVTAPRLLTKKEPEYTQEARSDHVQGTVVLRVVVGEDGNPSIVQIVNSLRPDLDQKAMDAVSQWTFTPGMKDGKPVKTLATVEVNFRLLDKPPAPPLQPVF